MATIHGLMEAKIVSAVVACPACKRELWVKPAPPCFQPAKDVRIEVCAENNVSRGTPCPRCGNRGGFQLEWVMALRFVEVPAKSGKPRENWPLKTQKPREEVRRMPKGTKKPAKAASGKGGKKSGKGC